MSTALQPYGEESRNVSPLKSATDSIVDVNSWLETNPSMPGYPWYHLPPSNSTLAFNNDNLPVYNVERVSYNMNQPNYSQCASAEGFYFQHPSAAPQPYEDMTQTSPYSEAGEDEGAYPQMTGIATSEGNQGQPHNQSDPNGSSSTGYEIDPMIARITSRHMRRAPKCGRNPYVEWNSPKDPNKQHDENKEKRVKLGWKERHALSSSPVQKRGNILVEDSHDQISQIESHLDDLSDDTRSPLVSIHLGGRVVLEWDK